ncbi:MAG TPA: methyltransferase [Bacillota bacterium]|nr:methyltransferase [Bacillota bacterium]
MENQWMICGESLTLDTDASLFSPDSPDKGTLTMLSHITLTPEDFVLDLGCGYGTVGLWAAKKIGEKAVYMTDIQLKAIEMSRINAQKNGFPNLPIVCGNAYEAVDASGFTWIISNPPYHTDFKVAKTFIEKGFNRLAVGGTMIMVTKRKEWYKNKFIAIFGGVKIIEENGYIIFMAQKRTNQYARKEIRK